MTQPLFFFFSPADFAEVLANINLVIGKDARNDMALQQRKVFLMSCVREMLNTMKDHVSVRLIPSQVFPSAVSDETLADSHPHLPHAQTMLGPERTQYLSFCSEVVEEINSRAGQTFDSKSFPEMTFLVGLS